MMNTHYSWENNILQHSTFNSTLKQATFIDNQRKYCIYHPWVQCYQRHLLHPVFSVCYFSSEFTILSNVSFETPCIMQSGKNLSEFCKISHKFDYRLGSNWYRYGYQYQRKVSILFPSLIAEISKKVAIFEKIQCKFWYTSRFL